MRAGRAARIVTNRRSWYSEPMICEWCETELPRVVKAGRSRRFCTARCRQAACRVRRAERPSAGLSEDRWTRCVGKRPATVTGRSASSTDPSTWSTFAEVQASSVGDGFGVMLGGGHLACHDLDHALDGGVLKPWAREVLDSITEPVLFVEVSMSGEGLHVFVEATEGPGRKCPVGDGGHEFYSRGRFIRTTLRKFNMT